MATVPTPSTPAVATASAIFMRALFIAPPPAAIRCWAQTSARRHRPVIQVSYAASAIPVFGRSGSAAQLPRVVQVHQEVLGRELDLPVGPLGGPVVAGDQAHPVQPAEVAEDERISRLGLVPGTLGE